MDGLAIYKKGQLVTFDRAIASLAGSPIADDEIDTSDIPELTVELLKRGRRGSIVGVDQNQEQIFRNR